jgi:hypothetical protein
MTLRLCDSAVDLVERCDQFQLASQAVMQPE